MPTLPLFDSSATQSGGSHRVTSPGGYEAWRGVAFNSKSQTTIAVSFHLGFVCRDYLLRYQRYRRRPTRCAPPLPAEYAAVTLTMNSPAGSIAQTSWFNFASTSGESGIEIGPHRFAREAAGVARIQGPGIDLTFRPSSDPNPVEASFDLSDAVHRWVLADYLCNVSGTIQIAGKATAVDGNGFHDQTYGTAPEFRPSFNGHLFQKGKVIVLKRMDSLCVASIQRDSHAMKKEPPFSGINYCTRWGLLYPREISLPDGERLHRPRVLASNFFSTRILYQAICDDEKGIALCDVVVPRRLVWPIVGRLSQKLK